MNKEEILNKAVKNSLKHLAVNTKKNSIVECAHNDFLNGNIDSFELLRTELLIQGYKERKEKDEQDS